MVHKTESCLFDSWERLKKLKQFKKIEKLNIWQKLQNGQYLAIILEKDLNFSESFGETLLFEKP